MAVCTSQKIETIATIIEMCPRSRGAGREKTPHIWAQMKNHTNPQHSQTKQATSATRKRIVSFPLAVQSPAAQGPPPSPLFPPKDPPPCWSKVGENGGTLRISSLYPHPSPIPSKAQPLPPSPVPEAPRDPPQAPSSDPSLTCRRWT